MVGPGLGGEDGTSTFAKSVEVADKLKLGARTAAAEDVRAGRKPPESYLEHVNKDLPSGKQGGDRMYNCANRAIATDAVLAGNPASARLARDSTFCERTEERQMLTLEEARTIAVANLPDIEPEITLVIMDNLTIAKPYGWVFFYDSKQYLETNDILYAIGGNGPMIVTHNGRCIRLGSGGGDGEHMVAKYEKDHWLSLKMPL